MLQKMRKIKLGNKGFSLVELIIVIAIMAVLIAVLAPVLIRYIESSRMSVDADAAGIFARSAKTISLDPTLIAANETRPSSVTVTWAAGGGITMTSTGGGTLPARWASAFYETIGGTARSARSDTFRGATNITIVVPVTTNSAATATLNGGTGRTTELQTLLSGIN